jgi:inosine/xanthosine triphosphatase
MMSIPQNPLIAVGSQNAPKIEATRLALLPIWPEATVVGVSVESGVRAQPWGMEEAIRGALNRARFALDAANADLGVGLEGSVEEGPGGMLLLTGWSAIVTADGRWGIGGGARTPLPPELAEMLRSGMELGPAIDQWLGRQGIRHAEGTVGVLTSGRLTRAESFANTLIHALASICHPEWYTAWQGFFDL